MSQLNKNDVLTLVCNLIYLVNGTKPETINQKDRLIGDLYMDSIELIDFLIQLEKRGIFIKKEKIDNEITVEEIVDVIVNNKN